MAPNLYELSPGTGSIRSHLVSLNPLRPENAPDPWEAQALRAFELGTREASRLEGSGPGAHLHLIRPFLIEKACLTCHKAQGYKEGDIRGGISVSVPMAPFWAMGRSHQVTIAIAHALLWIIGLAGIGVGTMNLRGQFSGRRRIEETLRQSEQRYRSILENMEEGYYEVDLEGTLTFANDAFYGILGWTKEEMFGANYRQIMRPEKADETFRVFNKVFRTGERARVTDWEMIHKDGSLRAIEASVIPLRTSENRCSGFGGVIRDVTERRHAEEELRTNKANLDLALQAAHMGVWRWNIAENKRVFDDRTCRLLGLDPATFDGTAEEFFAAVHPDDREKAKVAMTRTVEQDEPYAPEYRAVWPDGSIHHLGVRGSLERDEAGRPKRISGLLWDITETKEAEERLRLTDLEREKARGNALLAQLIQGLAHEVRNPLFAINTNIAVLEKTTGAVPGVAESIGFVKEHVGRLDSLMRVLLDLGHRPKAGDRVACRLRDVAKAAVLAVEAQTPKISGRVLVEAPEHPFTVGIIPDRLQRVLVHLIENALQNSPAESRVRVSVGFSDGQATVAVIDEGSGIPEKIRHRLFEPFVTTHAGRRGLGLALAKHYVESMGGTLEAADNDPAPGATFTVRLRVGGPGTEAKEGGTSRPELDMSETLESVARRRVGKMP